MAIFTSSGHTSEWETSYISDPNSFFSYLKWAILSSSIGPRKKLRVHLCNPLLYAEVRLGDLPWGERSGSHGKQRLERNVPVAGRVETLNSWSPGASPPPLDKQLSKRHKHYNQVDKDSSPSLHPPLPLGPSCLPVCLSSVHLLPVCSLNKYSAGRCSATVCLQGGPDPLTFTWSLNPD